MELRPRSLNFPCTSHSAPAGTQNGRKTSPWSRELRCTTELRQLLKGLFPCLLDQLTLMSSRLMPLRWTYVSGRKPDNPVAAAKYNAVDNRLQEVKRGHEFIKVSAFFAKEQRKTPLAILFNSRRELADREPPSIHLNRSLATAWSTRNSVRPGLKFPWERWPRSWLTTGGRVVGCVRWDMSRNRVH